jgi:NAD(P)-dependent dehydrogenase (short-subunit alcohol dehydrogenase family)
VVVDLRGPAAVQAAESLRHAGASATLALTCDVSQPDQVQDCVAQTLKEFRQLDVVVNNAGLMTSSRS